MNIKITAVIISLILLSCTEQKPREQNQSSLDDYNLKAEDSLFVALTQKLINPLDFCKNLKSISKKNVSVICRFDKFSTDKSTDGVPYFGFFTILDSSGNEVCKYKGALNPFGIRKVVGVIKTKKKYIGNYQPKLEYVLKENRTYIIDVHLDDEIKNVINSTEATGLVNRVLPYQI